MGYNTDFEGAFKVTPPLTKDEIIYLEKFSGSRRVSRNTSKLPGGCKYAKAVGLSLGDEGEHYVESADDGNMGQLSHPSVVSQTPPGEQPGTWCEWVPSDDGKYIQWNGGEKFYDYVDWIKYIIKHFIIPWGKKLDGEVQWVGEDVFSDRGIIIIKDNIVKVIQ